MSVTEFTLIIIATALCGLVAVSILATVLIRRAALSILSTSDMLNRELEPALKELTLLLSELKTVGSEVADHTDDLRCFMSALGEAGEKLSTLNRTVGIVSGAVGSGSAWITGAKVAGRFVVDRFFNKTKGGN